MNAGWVKGGLGGLLSLRRSLKCGCAEHTKWKIEFNCF